MLTPMTTNNIFLSFLMIGLIQFLAVISPGPDFAMVVKTAIGQSRRIAIYNAFGIALGVIVHVSYCILGLAVVITQSVLLFNFIKYLGAAYFIYLGIQSLMVNKTDSANKFLIHAENLGSNVTPVVAIKRGFFCNVLNPKATLFFLGLFTLVINPHTSRIIQFIYGIEIFLITFLWFALLATMITHPFVKSRITQWQHVITKMMGGLLIAFGCKLALLEHQ